MTDEELLFSLRPWLITVAWQYAKTGADAQELAQEGHIAAWRALQKWTPEKGIAKETHLKHKAKWRMVEVVQRGNLTGMESRQGKKYSAGTEANKDREIPMDFTVEHDGVALQQYIDSMIVAYHHGEIYEAINSLTPKQKQQVFDRFWRGIYDPKNSAWWFGKDYGVRSKLLEKLEHLRELV